MTNATRSITLGDQTITVEVPSTRKAHRALAWIRHLSRTQPAIQKHVGEFRRQYSADNYTELDRVQARVQFPEKYLADENGDPVRNPDGSIIFLPSPVDAITDAEWQATGGKLRLPKAPGGEAVAFAMLDKALELAEEDVYRILALMTLTNEEVKQHRNDLAAAVEERVEFILDNSFPADVLELAVIVVEVLEEHVNSRLARLGDRAGKALRMVGLGSQTDPGPATTDPTPTPSTSTPNTSTDSPASTDGEQATPSTSPSDSSSTSSSDSTTTATSEPEPPETVQ